MGIDGAEIKRQREAREREAQRQAERQSKAAEQAVVVREQQAVTVEPTWTIDCHVCKMTNGMDQKRLPRFPLFIRLIGTIIAVPSALGMAFGVFTAFVPKGGGIGLMVGGGIVAMSAVGGLIGWLLLMRKNVFVCRRCGYMLDRA